MRTRKYVSAIICLLLPMLAAAQAPRLAVPSFAELKATATDSVEITFGPLLLGLASCFMDDHDADSANLKKTIRGLSSVQVRNYRFKDSFVYPKDEIEALRAQLSRPGWSQLVKVRNRNEKEDVDIYIALENRIVNGVTIIASGQRELTIVNVIGKVDLDQIEGLRKTFTSPGGQLAQVMHRTP